MNVQHAPCRPWQCDLGSIAPCREFTPEEHALHPTTWTAPDGAHWRTVETILVRIPGIL